MNRLSRPPQPGDGTSPNAPPALGSDEELLTYKWKLAESRLRRLDTFVCDLSAAATVEGVGRVVLSAGMDAIGADMGTMWSIAGLTATTVARAPEHDASRRQTIALTASSPITQVVVSHEPLFFSMRDREGCTGVVTFTCRSPSIELHLPRCYRCSADFGGPRGLALDTRPAGRSRR